MQGPGKPKPPGKTYGPALETLQEVSWRGCDRPEWDFLLTAFNQAAERCRFGFLKAAANE